MIGWVLLTAAIVAEVIATTTLAYSDGLTRHTLTALTAVLYLVSYVCFAKALKAGVEISVGYAVWSGVGTAALAVIGASLFGERVTFAKIIAIALIMSGVLLLHLTGRTTAPATPSTAVGSNAQTGVNAEPATTPHDSNGRSSS